MSRYGVLQAQNAITSGLSVPDYNNNMTVAQREQALVEKMTETANRLEATESLIVELRNWLYGPEPDKANENYACEPNALSQANRAYYSVVRIGEMLRDIFRRLALSD